MKNQTTQNRLHARTLLCAVLFALLLATQNGFAQDRPIKFERIQVVQGQRLGVVHAIQQDSQGFMWFGTRGGLYRYDGYSLTGYKLDRLDSMSLGDNLIFAIHEDRHGTLWFGTGSGGLNRFDRKQEAFTRFVNHPKNPGSLNANVISAVYEDRSGTIWAGSWTGLNKLDRNTGQFTRFIHDPNNPHSMNPEWIFSIYEDSTGMLWVGTNGGLSRLDRNTEQFTHFVNDPSNPHSLSSNPVSSIIADRSGTLWVGTSGGLNRFDPERKQFTRFVHDPKNHHSLSSNYVSSILEDRTGTLWTGTSGGLNRFDRERKQFTRFVHDPENSYSLSNNVVQEIYEDRTGVLWIGTSDGVNRLDYEQQQFAHIVHDPENPNSLSHKSVGAIHEDRNGTLWIGTAGGLNKLDRGTGQFRHFIHNPQNPRSLRHNVVESIHEDRFGKLWVGTDGGLNRFDPEREQFVHFIHDPENSYSLSDNNISSIFEDLTGMLWVGTISGGLNRFDRDSGQFTRFLNDPENPNTLSGNQVRSIHVGASGRLWIGLGGRKNDGGLNLFDREREQFIRFVHDPDNPHSLSIDWVAVIFEDRAGTLWAAPWYGGLHKLDQNTRLFIIYTEKNGLSSDQIGGILEDDHGRLWMTTMNGLSRFDPQTETFKNFDTDDGLQNKGFNWNACTKSRSGEMFFGGENGIDYFHPDSIRDNPHLPPVVITRFTRYNSGDAEGKPIVEKGISEKQHIELSYLDRILTFEFAALNFRNTYKNQYAYKLEGFNENWIQLGAKRDITFTNLSPGQYTLRVKGSNNDGVWNEEGTSLKITVTPPWWRTRWAYAIYGLLFIAGIFATDRIQRRRLIKRERERTVVREANLRAQTVEAENKALQSENGRKKNVELLSEIGKEITASLDMDTIFYKLYEHVNQLADATIFGVGIYQPEKEQIEYRLAFEKGKRYAPYTRDTRDKNQFPVWCIENRSPVFINDVTQEYGRYLKAFKSANVEGMRLEDGTLPEEPFSIIYLPLLSQERVLGVITIQSFQKNAYTEYHLNLLQNLATYTTIALDNADAYRRLDATLQNLKATQQQLVTQEKLASLGQLTAGIAHEIKNPLNFVNNFAALSVDLAKELREEIGKIEDSGSRMVDRESLLKIEDGGSMIVDRERLANMKEILETLEQNAEKINQHGKRADGIVKSMMQHARGSSGKRELTDVNHLLDDAVNLVYHGMRANDAAFNVTIEKEYDETIGKLEVVPQDLSRVFLNVINNACYATQKRKKDNKDKMNDFSPTLSVSTKKFGDKIEIRIRDNGNGISPNIREKIFNPFFTTKPAGQGTGLGLSISYDIIVQEHRGEIRVETEEGRFTEFVVRLPRAKD